MRKPVFKLSSLLLALVLLLAALPFGTALADATPEATKEPAAQLTIFHTNDTHGRMAGLSTPEVKEDVTIHSSAKLAGQVKRLRLLDENVLLLSAGDEIQGTLSAGNLSGASVTTIMRTMGYDAMAIGNHEFDYGFERIKELESYVEFPMLAANLTYEATGDTVFERCMVKEFDDLKVGIFGLSTPETAVKTHPNYTRGIEFSDEAVYEAAEGCVAELEAKGCDYIIALGHIGLDAASTVRSELVVEKVEGIDLFIDGHSHTLLEEGRQVGDTLIVSTGEHFQNVGEVVVSFYEDGSVDASARLITPKEAENWPVDEKTQKYLDGFTLIAEKSASKVVGTTDELLDGEREDVRTRQTNLGSLITDAMLWRSEDADIAVTNGGGIRASIPVGDITYANVVTVLPFGNTLVIKEMKGADILTVLEEGVSAYPEQLGGFLHYAGISFTFDPSKPAGSRVVKSSVMVGDEPIESSKVYKVVTNDFLAAGGDGSSLGLGEVFADMKIPMDVALQEYLAKFGCVYEAGERVSVK